MRGAALGVIVVFCSSAAPAAASIPSPGSNNLLRGVSCAKGSNCWAVGQFQNTAGAYLNQALHFNGKQWTQAPIPQPGGDMSGALNDLYGVSCPAASDCWAVGFSGQGAAREVALRWNGKRWSSTKVPQPGGRRSGAVNELDSVACASRTDCWAVGVFTGKSGAFRNETLHWSGRKWSHVSAPSPGGGGRSAFNILESVSCVSPTNCWAAGNYETTAYFNQILHWNGKKWSDAKTPQPGGASGSNLLSISCASAADCVAVGEASTSGGASLNEALRFNGKKWTHMKTPQPGGTAQNDDSQLTGVSCISESRCWALGYFAQGLSAPSLSEALRWNGKQWTQVKTPQPGGTAIGNLTEPMGVWCTAASACRAVGQVSSGSALLNLALGFNGKKWSTN